MTSGAAKSSAPQDDKIPSTKEFLLKIPLYEKTIFNGALSSWQVVDMLFHGGTYDSYCTRCNRDSTFQLDPSVRPGELTRNLNRENLIAGAGGNIPTPPIRDGVWTIQSHCTREKSHIQNFIFFIEWARLSDVDGKPSHARSIQKIGQQPSYGDIHIAQVKQYSTVLTRGQLSELTRAIGLASHDVGIGSYVYLRRVFEALVEEAHQLAIKDKDWNDEKYKTARMSEKIAMLKNHLPIFLSANAAMYGLLSKGIHELTELECLKHFETIRIGIEMILDEKLEAKTRAQKIQSATTALQIALQGAE